VLTASMTVMPTSVYRARFRFVFIAFLVLISVHVYHNKSVTCEINIACLKAAGAALITALNTNTANFGQTYLLHYSQSIIKNLLKSTLKSESLS